MSGYSEAIDCPRCGSKESLEHSVDRDDVTGFCLECGYEYHTESSVLSLEQVNEERAVFMTDLEPLTVLKPPVEDWKD